MNDQVEKAIAALRTAIENAVAAAHEAGKQEAGREAIAKMTEALGVQPVKRTRRKRTPKV